MKKALIVWGGWEGHEPDQVAEHFEKILKNENFDVEISNTLKSFNKLKKILELDLIIPVWTGGKISEKQVQVISKAVANGVGIAGCHGGMCDAFRESVEWQFIMGGNWVSHPGGNDVEYTVNIQDSSSEITKGLKDFKVKSEHYYLHVDPAIKILATTKFPLVNWYHSSNGPVEMPVIWTKKWGLGNVFYTSLGHQASIVKLDVVSEIFRRGFLWASYSKENVIKNNLSTEIFECDLKMF